jgi:ATP-dependent helicase HrpA
VLELEQGCVSVHPTLARGADGIRVRFEWSDAEAARGWRHGAVDLARSMLERHGRDLAKTLARDTQLLLAAVPYLQGEALTDTLLHLVFRRACFDDAAAPRTREAFDKAVEQGRARLYPCLAEVSLAALGWFTEARAVRRLLDDPRLQKLGAATAESHAHLRRLLSAQALQSVTPDWLRQVTRYLKAEERRWQRVLARGSEPAQTELEASRWWTRFAALAKALDAEQRWIAQSEELLGWIEEYRVSLYAQELKTLGPVSAARLEQRAGEIEAWLAR